MENVKTPIEGIRLRSPVVDFIDNRLHEFHPAFANPQTHFNVITGHYVNMDASKSMQASERQIGLQFAERHPKDVTPQRDIFPEALKGLRSRCKDEPNGRLERGYSIRCSKNWDEVLSILQRARHSYYNRPGIVGTLKKASRKVGDNTDPINQMIRLIPDNCYTSPILGILNLLFDVRLAL